MLQLDPQDDIPKFLHRRYSLAASWGDFDGMREELDRLDLAQQKLQRELRNAMKTVETMRSAGDYYDEQLSE